MIDVNKKLALAFALVMLLLVSNAMLSYRALDDLHESHRWVVRTHELLDAVEATLAALIDAETGLRGYVITGEQPYLQPYREAIARIDGHLARFKRLSTDDVRQKQRFAALEIPMVSLLDEFSAILELQMEQGKAAAERAIDSGRGKQMMDGIRALILAVKQEENERLRGRVERARISYRNALLTLLLASVLGIVLLAAALLLVVRYINTRERAAAALRDAHAELEQRVAERTAELARANRGLRVEIEERQRAEAKLELFTKELERSNRELQDFAFVASHDLQEPLRKIQAFGDRLRIRYGEVLGGQGGDYLERMQNAAKRMHALINDLLAFSRITTQGRPFVAVNLAETVKEVLEDLEIRIQESHATVELGTLPVIEADPMQIRQLLQNLIGNALKFHRSGEAPHVWIYTEENAPDSCRLIVEDDGIGFEEKYLDRIFTPFQRLHGRSEYEGTGMGLAVCRKIAERHGGEITATSSPGQGTRFVVTLSLTHNQEEIAA